MASLPPDTPFVAPTVIVGPGRMGKAFELALRRAGFDPAVAGRRDLTVVAATAETALLCVPDAEIGPACERS